MNDEILMIDEGDVQPGVDVLDLGIIPQTPERWVVWLNPGDRFPYLHGIRKPIAVCTDDAQIYPSKAAAQSAIDSHTAAWKTSFPHARPSKL